MTPSLRIALDWPATPMLTCQEITALVTDFLEDRMSAEARLCFQRRGGRCRRCHIPERTEGS